MNAKLEFTKMQVQGNDFVVLDGIARHLAIESELVKKLADRHYGIGFDQCLLIEPSEDSAVDYNYRIFNADGNEVGQCGNGARAVAIWLKQHGYIENSCILQTIATKIKLTIKDNEVAVATPINIFPCKKIYQLNNEQHEVIVLDLGNPHAVIIINKLNVAELIKWGEFLNKHPDFPDGVNVEFLEILDKNNSNLQVYERGVGVTKSCGSGAVAATIAGIFVNKLSARVSVRQAGGVSEVLWDGHSDPVIKGDACIVYQGILDITQFTS
jgi:diaminopimelate epimerase